MKALARSVVDEDVLACSLAHSRCSVCHVWEQGTFDPMLRDMAAEKVISNLPIFLGSSGWLACAITAIAQNPARGFDILKNISRGVTVSESFPSSIFNLGGCQLVKSTLLGLRSPVSFDMAAE